MVLVLAVQGLWTATSAAADSPDFTVEAGPVDGNRSEDGASELSIVATNLSSNELRLSLSVTDGSCDSVVGQPSLAPYTAGEVTFTMNCEGGSAPRAAILTGKTTQVPEVPLTPASVPLQVTLKPKESSYWTSLWQFLWPTPLIALVGVIPPYLFWRRRPRGNPNPDEADVAAAGAGRALDPISGWWSAKNMGIRLPGITADWDFKDNWASSASLAAALFTAVFATGDSLDAVLGEAGTSKGSAIAVAAALSTAIIGSGPLWLTICKKRYEEDDGIAPDNTIGGVLLGSVVVLVGAVGLLFTAADILDVTAADGAAWAVAAVLLLYSWKSIPQTLALGYFGKPTEETVSASL
ncbi:MAG: hypothetical protein K5799_14935 [Erythrobacter sp.]|nr:hypothetical protein [Erythrobacter sp.]